MKKGFTLIELILVMGILGILLSIFTVGLVSTQTRSIHRQAVTTLAADLKAQQTKAMTGAVKDGVSPPGYGVYFLADRYVLFGGLIYDPGDNTNFEVLLPEGVSVGNITLTDNQVVFERVEGSVRGYTAGSDYVEIVGAGGEVSRLRLNRLGVIIEGI